MINFRGINSQEKVHEMGTVENHHRLSGTLSQIANGIFHSKENGINGEIDETVFQGKSGDCWLMSGVLSLSYTDEGKEAIKNAIRQDENGDYQVNFKGINKTYTIAKDEIDKNNVNSALGALGLRSTKYSTGDDDMLLLELAVKKAVEDKSVDIPTEDGITGGSAYYLYQLFTGNKVDYAFGDNKQETLETLEKYRENQDNSSATLGILKGFSGLHGNHAYAIKDYDGNKMTLVNPWDSGKEIKISNNSLIKHCNNYDVSVIDMTA